MRRTVPSIQEIHEWTENHVRLLLDAGPLAGLRQGDLAHSLHLTQQLAQLLHTLLDLGFKAGQRKIIFIFVIHSSMKLCYEWLLAGLRQGDLAHSLHLTQQLAQLLHTLLDLGFKAGQRKIIFMFSIHSNITLRFMNDLWLDWDRRYVQHS